MACNVAAGRLAVAIVAGMTTMSPLSLAPFTTLALQPDPAGVGQFEQFVNFDWPQHNFDLGGRRYSQLDEIGTSNVDQLTLKWSFPVPEDDIINQVTPVVLDGTMYFNAGSKLYAVNAATGDLRWTYTVEPSFSGATVGRRGPTSGAGVIYAYGGSGSQSVLYAVDARTGKGMESFGNKGRLQIADAMVRYKYPDKDPVDYEMAAPPAFYDGTLYVGLAQSEKRITGGLVAALDGATGAVKWVFNTIPQGPQDDGWKISKETWSGGARMGGGIWTTPAIDPELGLLFINAGNPFPDYAGNTRKGINLFTNSIVALQMRTGRLAWYAQTIHHDLWDWDLVTGPVLFDVTVGGQSVKGVGAAGKNCLLYLWHRENGAPINPIVEIAVPTTTDVPGEQPWPTQPFPFTAKGVPMQPFCSTFPIISDPKLAKRARQMYTPYSTKESYIVSHGGSSYGSPSFSPRTGLLYVTAKNAAISFTIRSLDATLIQTTTGSAPEMVKRDNNTGVAPTETVTAFNPMTGEVAWQAQHRSRTNIGSAGNLATAGNLVFQGSDIGEFYALDAHSGKELFMYKSPRGVRASPLTYQVGRRQYVTVVANDTVLTFGLP